MGSFEDHMRYGVAAYVLAVVVSAGVVVYLFREDTLGAEELLLAVGAAVAGFPFVVAGAGFPDVDHHAAKPHRFFKKWVSVISAVAGGYVLFSSGFASEAGVTAADEVVTASVAPEPVVGGAVAAVGGVVAGGVVFSAVAVLKPPHRGVTHTLHAGVVVAALIGVGVGYGASLFAPSLGIVAGGVASGGFFVGFLSHLQCDGLLVGFLPDAM